MSGPRLNRKQLFKIALVVADQSATQFAEEYGCSLTHLNQVLKDERESAPLIAAIDRFIAANACPSVVAA